MLAAAAAKHSKGNGHKQLHIEDIILTCLRSQIKQALSCTAATCMSIKNSLLKE